MSRAGVLQTDLGPELLEEVKREAEGLGLTASSYVRMLVVRRRSTSLVLSEKGAPKKRPAKRNKLQASGR